ncbi:acetylornithine deacetylase [Actibacterium sp. 188UL27-1]|nr:acetylornithine deacetylase [Actibacterium sp. 188UL27-1]
MSSANAYKVLEKLIGFPTISSACNLDLIAFVEQYLNDYGVTSTILHSACGKKAGLIATVGPMVPGGVILSGHTDVVPVDGQAWTSDPWTMRSEGGRLYGRGACDMKGFCAAALAMVPAFQAAGLKRPIHLAFSYDEEIGCFGVQPMISHMRDALPPVEAVIVGEPTELDVVNAHKGTWALMTRVTGHEVHSSICHQGVSAVMVAARLVTWLEDRMAENAALAPSARQGSPFDPPYTTLHVGRIKGGTSGNVTAGYCSFPTDIRVLPEEDMDYWLQRYTDHTQAVQEKMRGIHPDVGIAVEVKARVAGLSPEVQGTAEALVRQLMSVGPSQSGGFGSEAGLFQEAGYSTVVCGPGSMMQAHQPDEYICEDQMEACTTFFQRLADKLAV